jgi:hypothetical protein
VAVKADQWGSIPVFRKHISKLHLYLIFCGSVIFSTGLFGQNSGVGKAAELYVDFEYGKAITMLTPLVEQGDRAAKLLTAFIFSDPFSDYYDPIRARLIFDELAAQGDADAALMLFDESYWNEAVDMQQVRANLSDKTIELLLTAAEKGYHPAYYRMMLACRYEGLNCGDFMNWSRPEFTREFIHMSRVLHHKQFFDKLIAKNGFDVFNEPPIENFDDISAMVVAADTDQGRTLGHALDVTAQFSDPYLASFILVLSAKSMQESGCLNGLVSTAYAVAIVERNDFWNVVKNLSKDDDSYREILACALKLSHENEFKSNDYELLLSLVEPLMPVFNRRKAKQWQGIAESSTTYTKWCFANAQQGSFFRCQFQSFADHSFRCNSLALDGFLHSLGVRSHRVINNGAGRRYHQCRANYLQKS